MDNLGLDDALNDASTESGARKGISRRTIMKGAAWTVPALMVSTAAPAYALSSGACANGNSYNAQSRGRLISGQLGTIPLNADTATVYGVHAAAWDPSKAPGTAYPGYPGPSSGGVNDDTQVGPLTVAALNALTVAVGLKFDTGAPTAAINQYATANRQGYGLGASGAVSSTGVVDLNAGQASPPALATLDLRTILQNVTGGTGTAGSAVTDVITNATNLDLAMGAMWGRGTMTACSLAVARDYAISYLRLVLKSNYVSALLTPISNLGSVSINAAVNTALKNLLGPVLGTLLAVTSNLTVSVNTAALTGDIPTNADAALRLNLGSGTATMDVGSLIGGLNSKSPNTRLFVDANAVSSQSAADLVSGWINTLLNRIVTVSGSVNLKLAGVINQNLNVSGTLGNLTVTLGSGSGGGGLDLGLIASTISNTILTTLTTSPALKTALDNLQGLLASVFTVLQRVILIALNLENGQPSSWTLPADFTSLPTGSGDPTGQYDVAALHVGVVSGILLSAAYPVVNLHIARGSVGQMYKR